MSSLAIFLFRACFTWTHGTFFFSITVYLLKLFYFEFFINFQACIKKSELLINNFCCMSEGLYGAQHMSANLHQILHLPKCVQW